MGICCCSQCAERLLLCSCSLASGSSFSSLTHIFEGSVLQIPEIEVNRESRDRVLSCVVIIKDNMEKKAKSSGNRPNQSNGSMHRHGHMSSSAAASAVHGRPGNFNLRQQDDHNHHEKTFRRSRSFCGGPFQAEKAGEASYSSSKLKKNTATMMKRPNTHPELLNRGNHPVLLSNTKMNTPVEALTVNKLLVKVTVVQSSGPLRLLLSKDATVEDVIKGTLLLYAKEGRKPLHINDSTSFGLHILLTIQHRLFKSS